MEFTEKITTLTIDIPVNITIVDEDGYTTPKTKPRCTTPPPAPRANRRNRLKFYSRIPFPHLGDFYSASDKTKKNRCESLPPIPKFERFGNIKSIDLSTKKLKYDEDILN